MPKKRKKKLKKGTVRKERQNKRELEEKKSLIRVIGTIIAVFLAIFLILSNMMLCGTIGDMARSVMLTFFGTFGYSFPIILAVSILINIYNDDAKANLKIYALVLLYIFIICLLETIIRDFDNATNLSTVINDSVLLSKKDFSFIDFSERFSGGVVGTAISYVSYNAIGKVGSLVLFGALTLITFILLFGLGIAKDIVNFLKAIVLLIPNILNYFKERKEHDIQIEIENEDILRRTIEKNKRVGMEVAYNGENKLKLEPVDVKKKQTFDTSNIRITPNDIQSRFYTQDDNVHIDNTKSHLLDELKTKSINEVLYEQKEKGNEDTSFFYTDGMKPIDELKNISLPSSSVEEEYVYDNNKTFASGLDKLNNDSKVDNPKEFLENIKDQDLEYKNNNLSDEELVGRSRKKVRKYKFPPVSLLSRSIKSTNSKDQNLNEKANILVETLKQFGVGVTVTDITVGPSVTRFELKPDVGVKISKILSLEDDVKLALAASEIRIEAPIPGKSAVGIEVANAKSSGVLLGDIISTPEFKNAESKLTVAIGKDISGKPIITDLRKMPHLLIAGATGSGKSVCVNSLITSLIYKSSPEDVRLIMVDPKVVELQIYDGIPHLLTPVVTNPKKAAGALAWAVSEMTRRYNLIQEKRVRDIESYNKAIEGDINRIKVNDNNEADFDTVKKLPYIVIIIDEFADLMVVASKEVENSIMRIAQLARACGIYLVIATQRPTVNVISGSIKTNVPSRISFAVSSGIDSQTILDRRGAEKLLGHGDMLYFPTGIPEPIRVQGCYISEKEILDVVNYVKEDEVVYDMEAENAIEKGVATDSLSSGYDDEKDDMFLEAGRLVIDQQNASIGMLQRRFRMGFNRAARIIDQLETEGVISAQDGKKPREILITAEEFEKKFGG